MLGSNQFSTDIGIDLTFTVSIERQEKTVKQILEKRGLPRFFYEFALRYETVMI